MSQAYINCPTTKKDIYVGLNLEWSQLDGLEMPPQDIICSKCGDTHRFEKEDMLLRADGAGG